MSDDPNDTLTNIEAKVLCLRYGINDIDEDNSINKLRKYQSNETKPDTSMGKVAKTLGEKKSSLKATEINALRKLKLRV